MKNAKIPHIEATDLESEEFSKSVFSLLSKYGAFQLRAPDLISKKRGILQRASQLFSLPESEKSQYMIDRESSYSGYSLLKNDRDYREQFHLFYGFSNPVVESDHLSYLKSPNKIPRALSGDWGIYVHEYFDAMVELAECILAPVEEYICLPGCFNVSSSSSSYSLIKMINYLPVHSDKRLGTPPHIDWSWLTIVAQDTNPGLSLKMSEGQWQDFILDEQSYLVLAGELLELSTSSQIKAVPHKVVMQEGVNERLSAPFFYSPDLNASVKVASNLQFKKSNDDDEHIHRVFDRQEVHGEFHFGASELMRKRYKRWCQRMDCCG